MSPGPPPHHHHPFNPPKIGDPTPLSPPFTLSYTPRCLQDNDWDYGRAGQVFTQLKVGLVGWGVPTQHPPSPPKLGVPSAEPPSSLFSLQVEGKIPDVAFLK